MPSFSPSTYLASQGWSGPGSGLRPGSRARPVTVAKRKDLLGLGKERDTAFAWWDDVFKAVAEKVGGGGGTEPNSGFRRTKTGIISPLPPPEGASTAVNADMIASAKQTAARRQLYGRFLRGRVIEGTVEDDDRPPPSNDVAGDGRAKFQKKKGKRKTVGGDEEEARRMREEKRARKAAKAALAAVAAPTSSTTPSAPTSGRASPRPVQPEAAVKRAPEKGKKRALEEETPVSAPAPRDPAPVEVKKKRRKGREEVVASVTDPSLPSPAPAQMTLEEGEDGTMQEKKRRKKAKRKEEDAE